MVLEITCEKNHLKCWNKDKKGIQFQTIQRNTITTQSHQNIGITEVKKFSKKYQFDLPLENKKRKREKAKIDEYNRKQRKKNSRIGLLIKIKIYYSLAVVLESFQIKNIEKTLLPSSSVLYYLMMPLSSQAFVAQLVRAWV